MTVEDLNTLSVSSVRTEFARCCGSSAWVEVMLGRRPFKGRENIFSVADEVWRNLTANDWKEAFTHHPKIGEVDSLRKKFAQTSKWAEGEQSGVKSANDDVLAKLAEGNRLYEKKFGYIFIVCATGKSAGEMLQMLQQRLPNEPETEIHNAAAEQAKITRLRLEKLLGDHQ